MKRTVLNFDLSNKPLVVNMPVVLYSMLLAVFQMRNEATKAGSAPARESIWQYFVTKCSNNLHIVMAMSPVGDTLRTRCRNFPGMVNNASIDWFFPWPDQALFAVASTFISPDVSLRLHTGVGKIICIYSLILSSNLLDHLQTIQPCCNCHTNFSLVHAMYCNLDVPFVNKWIKTKYFENLSYNFLKYVN